MRHQRQQNDDSHIDQQESYCHIECQTIAEVDGFGAAEDGSHPALLQTSESTQQQQESYQHWGGYQVIERAEEPSDAL